MSDEKAALLRRRFSPVVAGMGCAWSSPVRLGYDLDTLEGNADVALWPYEKEGSQPLESSRTARERRRQH